MANQGGPNEIGKVSVGVEANIQPLLEGLEKAKVAAQQASADIQQKTGPTGGAASAYGYGTTPGEMAESVRQTDNRTRANYQLGDSFQTIAGQVALLTANLEKFYQAGSNIGTVLAGVVKETLEYEQAVRQANVALEKSLQLRQQFTTERVGGNAVAGNAAEERVQTLERENAALRAEMDSPMAVAQDYLERFPRGVYSLLTGGEGPTWSTTREQRQQQVDENERAIDFNRRESQKFRDAQEERFTVGGIAASLAGLPAGSLPPIQRLSPSGAAMTRDFYSNNPDLLDMLVKYHQMSYMQREQQIIEAMRGNREVNYR